MRILLPNHVVQLLIAYSLALLRVERGIPRTAQVSPHQKLPEPSPVQSGCPLSDILAANFIALRIGSSQPLLDEMDLVVQGAMAIRRGKEH